MYRISIKVPSLLGIGWANVSSYFTVKSLVLFWLAVILVSCNTDDEYQPTNTNLDQILLSTIIEVSPTSALDYYILPDSDNYDNIPHDLNNPITSEKVALGKLLVHETATGGNPKMAKNIYTYACATCHPVASGFNAGIRQGIGEGGIGFGLRGEGRVPMSSEVMPRDSIDVQPVKPPTILNVAYSNVALWNGALGAQGINEPFVSQNLETIPENDFGFLGVETQAIAGQKMHRLKIDEQFINQFGYKDLFDAAFPDVPIDVRYTRITAALAIAAYNRTLLTNQAPWQQWLKGNKQALTDEDKRGAILFFSKGRCYECHDGPALKKDEFYALAFNDFNASETILFEGLKSFNLPTLLGRGQFTGNPADNYKFKVPTLYNLKMNSFYGHGGSFTSIRDLIQYMILGIKQNNNVPNAQLPEQFGEINLTESEINDLVTFIEQGLFDPDLSRYAPSEVLSGNCIPNNDIQSQIDLGCN
jgi:cytochrome c peroxidase